MIPNRPRNLGPEGKKLTEHGIWRCDDKQWWCQVCPLKGYTYVFEACHIKQTIIKYHEQYVDAPVKIPYTDILVGNGFHVNTKHLTPIRTVKMSNLCRDMLLHYKDTDTSTKGARAQGVFLDIYDDVFGPPSKRCQVITDKDEQNKCRDVYVPRYNVYVEIKYDYQGGLVYKSFSQTNDYPSFMIQTHERNDKGLH